jgi:SAM-dependent methyltransferase
VPYRQAPEIEAWRAGTGGDSDYAWRLCRRCGNAYPTEPPSLGILARCWETIHVVDGADPAHAATVWEGRREAGRINAERSYRLLAPFFHGKPGRFLDIACGLGETVRLFAERGWDAEGTDADPTMLPIHQKIGICSRIGQIETMELDGSYDIIHIAHAIYFITDPMAFLAKLRSRLTQDGLLCIVLSDLMSSLDSGLPSYSHTFYPSVDSMRYALALASFESVLVQRTPGSIYLVARAAAVEPPRINTRRIYWLHRTKPLRLATLGRAAQMLRPLARKLLRR